MLRRWAVRTIGATVDAAVLAWLDLAPAASPQGRDVHRPCHTRAVIDDFIEFIFGACRRVAKKPAQLRANRWCEEQGDARADQRSYKKSR